MALILLDAGLVGLLIAEPRGPSTERRTEVEGIQDWYAATAGMTHDFAIADVTLYEVQRGLLHKGAPTKLKRLDDLRKATIGIGIDLETWVCAAHLWARSRHEGKPTADEKSLDGDAILAAVAVLLAMRDETVIVATTNVRHLIALGADARGWREIPDHPDRR